MKINRAAAVVAVAATVIAGSGASVSAQAADPTGAATKAAGQRGQTPLSAVLTRGGVGFDHNSHDFDVLTAAVLAVLKAKPSSPVSALTDGSVKLTAFLPTDEAFRRLVHSLTGRTIHSEKKVFKAVAGLGIDTVEAVLEYHVVPGTKITAKKALQANGVPLTTAQGGIITVRVTKAPEIRLRDKDPNARNARVILGATDINKGNRQIAHAVDRVLRPVDLPKAA